MHSMKLVLWGLHHIQNLNLHQLHQPDHHILLQGLKRCTRLHPSYLLATTVAILPTKLLSATFFLRISFVIIVGKKDIKKLFELPSSQNGSNFDSHGKICQHLPLPFKQKLKHLNLPLRFSPPRVIPVRMLRRRSTMLTRGRCFKPMSLKFKLCKMNSNHWMPNLYRVQDHEIDLLGRSMACHMMPWLGSMFFLVHTILLSHQNLPFFFALPTSQHKKLMWHQDFLPLGR